jgi:methionyl aminopeptidase
MIHRNDFCWCGSGKKWKKCHFPQSPPFAAGDPQQLKDVYQKKYQILLKSKEQIEGIRQACRVSSDILEKVSRMAAPGVTTKALDDLSTELHRQVGAIPAALHYGYPPFPKGICTSLNEVICHGIPDDTPLKEGDILNVDIASIYKGYYGDCSRMVVIGKTTPDRQLVVDVSYECLMRAIAILQPGIEVGQIGAVIEDYARSQGCSVVRQFVAHGVGVKFHENPQVPHFRNSNKTRLVPGMTFTIEPMINAGEWEAMIDPVDQWTARTIDGKPSAQWEHTVLITDEGHEILTNWVR